MSLQYLAARSCYGRNFAALQPQRPLVGGFRCDSACNRAILSENGPRALRKLRLRLYTASGSGGLRNTFRRQKCPRASSLSRWQDCWRWLPPVATVKKSSLWLSPSPSRLSPPTPANTSNKTWGPALWPAPAVPRGAGSEAPSC